VQEALAIATGGREAGIMFEGDRRFDILVRCRKRCVATWMRAACRSRCRASGAATSFIPLSEVATLDFAPGPNQISRENGKRRIVISANVTGRDIGSFVPRRSGDRQQVKIPPATGPPGAARSSSCSRPRAA
jgi:cobalt-zinc-cadmium resistance protein CzcA